MLFSIKRYASRACLQYVRRCMSTSVDIPVNDSQEFVLQVKDDFTSIRQESKKSLKIAILGVPNVGKSTLINQLVKRSICPASSKVHTTRTKAEAIYCQDDTQLIFMDTPGMVSTGVHKRFNLPKNFMEDPKVSLRKADIVGIVQDVHSTSTRDKIDQNILGLLTEDIRNKIPMILIFNKVDILKKKNLLLHLVNVLTKSKNNLNFCDVFMVSALTGDGIDDLRTYFLDSAKPGDWHYKSHMYSDLPCEDIIQQMVRAKLLDNLPNEIPYGLKIELKHFDLGPDDSIKALVSITCPNKRIVGVLLCAKGNRMKNIAVMVEEELRHAFRTPVRLKLDVQSAK